MSLSETGLDKALAASFVRALDAVDLGVVKFKDPTDGVWDGKGFGPLLAHLALAADEGRLDPATMAKFLHVAFAEDLGWSGGKGLEALRAAMESDPFLATLAKAGISAKEVFVGVAGGVAFDTHAEAAFKVIWQIDAGNAAPALLVEPEIGLSLAEGGTITVDRAFADRDGDAMKLVVEGAPPGLSVHLDAEGNLVLAANHRVAGLHDLTIRATDGYGESAALRLLVDISDSGPGVTTWNGTTRLRIMDQHDTLQEALAATARSRLIDIHHAGALDGAGALSVAAENLTINGAAGLDAAFVLAGNVARLTLAGGADLDVTGNARGNQIQGNAGANALSGGNGADMLRGGAGADQLAGNVGMDRLWGDEGNDILNGGSGQDQLFGGAGDDILRGGAGRDQATGGAGADVFVFAAGDQTLIIRDLAAEDTIRIEGFAGVDDMSDLHIAATGPNTRIHIGDHEIILMGTAAPSLTADSFDFV